MLVKAKAEAKAKGKAGARSKEQGARSKGQRVGNMSRDLKVGAIQMILFLQKRERVIQLILTTHNSQLGRGNSNDSFLTEKGKGYSIELFNFPQWLAEKTPSNGEVNDNSVKANQD